MDTFEKIDKSSLDENLQQSQQMQFLQKVRLKPQNKANVISKNEDDNIVEQFGKFGIQSNKILSQRSVSNDNASFGRADGSLRKASINKFDIPHDNNKKGDTKNSILQSEIPFASTHILDSVNTRKPLSVIKIASDGKVPVRKQNSNRCEQTLDAVLDKENIPVMESFSSEPDKVIVYSPDEHLKKLYNINGPKQQIPQNDFYALLFDYRCLWQEVQRLQVIKKCILANKSRD